MKFDKLIKKVLLLITFLALIVVLFFTRLKPSPKCLQMQMRENELKLLNEIFTSSDEQILIEKSVLMKTISFMIQEVDELDPALIEFVRSLIHVPHRASSRKLNLTQKNRRDFSQIGQSKWVDGVLKGRRDGFFIEAGAYNGEDHSVKSLFYLLLMSD